MTSLFKAVEGAREALEYYRRGATKRVHGYTEDDGEDAAEALSLLPDGAKTEDQVARIILNAIKEHENILAGGQETVLMSLYITRALRDAGVLYVKEGDKP